MSHIFISYSRQDRFFVQYLHDRLVQNVEYYVWFDKKIIAGNDWSEEIDEYIANSFVFILVLSPDALKSQYVNYEWAYAKGHRIPIIPLLFRANETDIPVQVNKSQLVNFQSPLESEHQMNELINGIEVHSQAYRRSENDEGESILRYLARKKQYATIANVTAYHPMGNYKYKYIHLAYKHPKIAMKHKIQMAMRMCRGNYLPAIPDLIEDMLHAKWDLASTIMQSLHLYGSSVVKPLIDTALSVNVVKSSSNLPISIIYPLKALSYFRIEDFDVASDRYEVFEFLEQMMKHEDPNVRFATMEALHPNYLDLVSKDYLDTFMDDDSETSFGARSHNFKSYKTVASLANITKDLVN